MDNSAIVVGQQLLKIFPVEDILSIAKFTVHGNTALFIEDVGYLGSAE